MLRSSNPGSLFLLHIGSTVFIQSTEVRVDKVSQLPGKLHPCGPPTHHQHRQHPFPLCSRPACILRHDLTAEEEEEEEEFQKLLPANKSELHADQYQSMRASAPHHALYKTGLKVHVAHAKRCQVAQSAAHVTAGAVRVVLHVLE